MTSPLNMKIQAAVLTASLLLPVGSVYANQWSKPESRTRGTVIGAVAGALVGGKKGALIGAAVGNGVQYVRHSQSRHHHRYRTAHYRRHTRR